MVVVFPSPPPYSPDSALCDFIFSFSGMNQDLKGRLFTNVAEIQRESLSTLDSIYVEDCSQRLAAALGSLHPGTGGVL